MASQTLLPLVNFKAVHIDEDCTQLKGEHQLELFHNCTFNNLNGLTLKDCTLTHSKVITNTVPDAMGLTITMDCRTFDNLELSPLMFDMFMVMLLKTKGNEEKRKRLIDILGRERLHQLLKEMKQLDS